MTQPAFTIWITGLPCAGKTTVGKMLTQNLLERGLLVQRLDGDEVRRELCSDLGFSRADRHTNNLRVAYVAGLLNKWGVVSVVCQVTPYADTRSELRRKLPEFVEVFLDCPLEQLINRDVKGHYKKALAGEIKNFTGINDPYEPPEDPEVYCNTHQLTLAETVTKITGYLEEAGLIGPAAGGDAAEPYTSEQEAVVKKRLADLGYL